MYNSRQGSIIFKRKAAPYPMVVVRGSRGLSGFSGCQNGD